MSARPLPAKDKLTPCFAHVAYRMGERFAQRNAGLDWFEAGLWGVPNVLITPHTAGETRRYEDNVSGVKATAQE